MSEYPDLDDDFASDDANRQETVDIGGTRVMVVLTWADAVPDRRAIYLSVDHDDGLGALPKSTYRKLLEIAIASATSTAPPFVLQTNEDDGGEALPMSLLFGVRRKRADGVFDEIMEILAIAAAKTQEVDG